ncbi:MAG: M2 family metallopeptidase [archaeon]|nr:M2 family metallopeptidase [archaeon]
MDEKEISQFLEEQAKEVRQLYINYAFGEWESKITGKPEAYEKYEQVQKEMAKFFNNTENFEKTKEYLNSNPKNLLIKRQLRVLHNSYLTGQGDLKLINKILEKSTILQQKFNTFRAKIGGKELTDNQIKEILKTETDSKKLQEAWEASKKQGELVVKELIELIKLRNRLAKSLGYKNYYILSLEANEQTEKDVVKIFEELDKSSDTAFKQVKKEMDEFLSKKYKTKELKPWHYSDLFFQEAPEIYHAELDKFYTEDVVTIAQNFYSSIGTDVSDILKRSDLYEKPKKYQHACCIDMDKEGDVRIIMNSKNNEKWMEVTLHELGHGIYQKYIDSNLPYLIRDNSHLITTEAIAQLFGRNSKNVSFIKDYCKVNASEIERLKEQIEKSLKLRELVFSRWSQVMVNFERQLYENPDQDLNKLWWKIVKQYQLIDFSRDKADWASKIHLVSAPVYYHNYLIGELYSSQITNHIAKNILKQNSLKNLKYSGNKQIGEYLKTKIFFPGASMKWDDLIEYSTGEKLNPKYWVQEFC